MSKMSSTAAMMARCVAKDLFDEMVEETERLSSELQMCYRYIDLCRQYRQLVLDFRMGCMCDQMAAAAATTAEVDNNNKNDMTTRIDTVEIGYAAVEESMLLAVSGQQPMVSDLIIGCEDIQSEYRPPPPSPPAVLAAAVKRRSYTKRNITGDVDTDKNDVIVKLVKDRATNQLRKRYYYFNHKCHWDGCERRFGKRDQLLAHISSAHTQQRPYKCSQCDRTFATETYRRQHHDLQHKDKDVVVQRQIHECCFIGCQKTFTGMSGLAKHRRTVHSDGRPFVCTQSDCSAKYKSNDALKNHVLIRHPTTTSSKEVQYHCCPDQSCSRKFSTAQKLDVHQQSRHSSSTTTRRSSVLRRNCRCHWPGCDYSGTKQELGIHFNRHQNHKPYLCSHQGCHQTYYTDYDLRQHTIKVHVVTNPEDKQFRCTAKDCTKTYATERDLKRHLRRHDRIYRCSWPECDQSYAAKVHLAEHMDRHLNRKSHKCHICAKEFFSKTNCRTHLKNVHKFY
ncbi:zinc finger protein Xfin-like [Oppia nitens]|uniref:zinc finger protein Xfin-like n=1 Tax=Oppia nitens TaxID=1686743 RepID=UPI0023DB3E75|nr:zinc finger protein Xfin-like [Oppia nitens]